MAQKWRFFTCMRRNFGTEGAVPRHTNHFPACDKFQELSKHEAEGVADKFQE
jgi:hypothetical protein